MDNSTKEMIFGTLLADHENLLRLYAKQSRHLELAAQQPNKEPEPWERLLRLPELMRRTGLSKRSIYRLESLGRFPNRRQIGLRAVAWPESQLLAWITNPSAWPPGEA